MNENLNPLSDDLSHEELDIEKKLIERVQSTTNETLKENAEIVLKSLVDIKKLESEELEKKQLEVKVKVLVDKEKQVIDTEAGNLRQKNSIIFSLRPGDLYRPVCYLCEFAVKKFT